MADSARTLDRLRQLIPVLGFNLAYLLAAIVGSVASGNSGFILYILIMLILGSVVWFADRRVQFSLADSRPAEVRPRSSRIRIRRHHACLPGRPVCHPDSSEE